MILVDVDFRTFHAPTKESDYLSVLSMVENLLVLFKVKHWIGKLDIKSVLDGPKETHI